MSSGRSSWRAFLALPRPDRTVLVGAALVLPPMGVLLRIAGYDRLKRSLGRLPAPTTPADAAAILRTDRMVKVVASRQAIPSTCLSRSLTLWLLLRLQGVASDICLGVRREGDGLDAHAWVEHEGHPLNDASDVRERFGTISRSPPYQ